jgi:hypothetical protein
MGLFSKIFGGTEDGSETGASADATPREDAVPPRTDPHAAVQPDPKQNATAPAREANAAVPRADRRADAAAAAAKREPLGRTAPGTGAQQPAKPATAQQGPAAPANVRAPLASENATARPSVPAKIEAKLHAQPSANVPIAQPSATVPITPKRSVDVAITPKRSIDVSARREPAKAEPRAERPPTPAATPPSAAKPATGNGASGVAAPSPAPPTRTTAAKPAASAAPLPPPQPIVAPRETPAIARQPGALELEPLPFPDAPAPRPPQASAPEITASALSDEVDTAFERIATSEGDGAAAPGALVDDAVVKEQNAELFRHMAVGHARPLREFMLELVLGPTTKQWLDVAKPSVTSLKKGADALGQEPLSAALSEYETALDRAALALGPKIHGPERDGLVACYDGLVRALPLAFDLKEDRDRREPLLVHQLLLQIPGVHKVTLDKLYAAGLASLDALCRASVEDLVAIGRLEPEGAEAIVARFKNYWRERTEAPREKLEDGARERLKRLVERLDRAHSEFQRAEADEDRERKRRARSERRVRALEMNVLLAEIGEVDLVAELERSPTERKIERVRRYIESRSALPRQQEAV